MFQQKINMSRKRENGLKNLRLPERGTMVKCNDGCQCQLMKLHEVYVKSPRPNHRPLNSRTPTMQRNTTGLQKVNLKHLQRIAMSKSVDVTIGAENPLQYNPVSSTKYSQVVGNLRTKHDNPKLELEARGQTVPKFVMRLHPRALERRLGYEQAQRHREQFEHERETSFVIEEKTHRSLEEKEKRQRIKDYMLKRHEEKELKVLKAQQRIKFMVDLEKAMEFDRKRLLAHAIFKFRNMIRWQIRNRCVSDELRRRILVRSTLGKWKQHMICVWGDRKERAIAFHNRHCLKIAWAAWQRDYLIARSHKWTAQDWFDLRLSDRVFRAWNRSNAQTRHLFQVKKVQADAHFNWLLKWRVLERWRRLHAILQIEKEAEARRERWRIKATALILEC